MKGGARINNTGKRFSTNEILVSVITVVLNGEKHIEECILSVLNQSYKNIEYIIIDGKSSDNTINIIKKHENKIDYWHSETDGGIYYAMNKGIELANGEIIGILNADDYYLIDSIEKIVETHKIQNAGVYYGDMLLVNKEKKLVLKPDISKMNQMPAIYHPTCFVTKKVYTNIGLFDTRFKISSDYEFLLRCIRKKIVFHYLPTTITAFRPGGMSASCASNIEGYKIMKMHQTGFHRQVIGRAIKCYIKTFLKKIIHLK